MSAEFSMDLMNKRLESFGNKIETTKAMVNNLEGRDKLTLRQSAIKAELKKRPAFSWKRVLGFIPFPYVVDDQFILLNRELTLIDLDLNNLDVEGKVLLEYFDYYIDKQSENTPTFAK